MELKKIEIIIPTLNEERTLSTLIKDIRSSTLSARASILVIDGGSTDLTIDICKRENVRYLVQNGKGRLGVGSISKIPLAVV